MEKLLNVRNVKNLDIGKCVEENKQDTIIKELKRRAEETKYGELTVKFSVHQGKIMAGEIIGQKIKLS